MTGKSDEPRARRNLCWTVALLGMLVPMSPTFAQCDPPLPPSSPEGPILYSLNGQTVEASGLGDFFISNVAAPDVFPADFLGDDFLFLAGMKITDDGTTYYYSPVPFQINVGGRVVFTPSSLVETTVPPPLPESIAVTTTGSPVIEQGTSVDFTTESVADAVSITFPDTGLPLVPSGYVDPVTNLQRLQDIRSGDIILLSNYSRKHRNAIAPAEEGDPNGLDGGYYFGSELPCWHGSLYDTDMTIPIVFGFPRGSGTNLDAFLDAVGATLPRPPNNL